jgi:hypothetical protein
VVEELAQQSDLVAHRTVVEELAQQASRNLATEGWY